MSSRCSSNPEARQRTLDLLHEKGEHLIDWIARLKYVNRASDAEILGFATHRGFIDEEIEGLLIELEARAKDQAGDFLLDLMLEIRALPETK